MAWAIVSELDTTTTPGTEQTLVTDATNGTYVLKVSVGNLASGETLECRAKTVLRSGASVLLERLVSLTAAPYDGTTDAKSPNINVFSVPIIADQSVTFTIKQLTGSARVIPWKVLKSW